MTGSIERPKEDTVAGRILDLLFERRWPHNRSELAASCFTTERSVRRAINTLNELGWPIVSCGDGFYLARDAMDIYNAADRLMSEALCIIDRSRRLRKLAANIDQIPLNAAVA